MRNLMKIFGGILFVFALFSCVPNVAPSPAYAGEGDTAKQEKLLFITPEKHTYSYTNIETLGLGVRSDMLVDFCAGVPDGVLSCSNTAGGQDIYLGTTTQGYRVFALARKQYVDGVLVSGYIFYICYEGEIWYVTVT